MKSARHRWEDHSGAGWSGGRLIMPRRTDTLTVEEVQARFEAWRQKRQGRTAIPDELWSAASQLARRHGVNRTAAALRLDGGKLKRRMAAAGTGTAKRAMPPAFVELIAPRSAV